jgi:hypothetical protein
MSPTIYLDHNVVVGVAGRPAWADAPSERERIERLRAQGVQFVLSAWHMYELAKSEDLENVRSYCQFVDVLKPLWAKNPVAVKRAELQRFLDDGSTRAEIPPISPFSDTVDAMWLSYGEGGTPDATFTSVVRALRSHPSFLEEMNAAADLTPDAIVTGRDAYRDGRLKSAEPIIDREYFAGLLGCSPRDPRLDGLLENIKPLYRACPTIAVEDVLMHVRVKDGFTPRTGHAPDFQHALIGLAYCTAFVTDDKSLLENSRVTVNRLNLPTGLTRRVTQIPSISEGPP